MIANLSSVPVTVFTGYLGSGKTTIILNLISQLDPNYKVVWLKNEYGNMSVDSELAKENNIAVKEMLNGCVCCVLVGKLGNALLEILDDYQPDRIIIESSGTAYPLPIALEIERNSKLKLDGIINVIDAVNFRGYPDKGRVAAMQMEVTNLVLINKTSQVDPNQLELVLDEIYELVPAQTPVIHTADAQVPRDILIGLDTKQLDLGNPAHDSDHDHPDAVETIEFTDLPILDKQLIEQALVGLVDKDLIRIKGVIPTADKTWILNWVMGKTDWREISTYSGSGKIVFMGKHIRGLEPELSHKIAIAAASKV